MRFKSLAFMPSILEILHSVSILALVWPVSISAMWLRDTAAIPESTSVLFPKFPDDSSSNEMIVMHIGGYSYGM